MLGPSVHVDTFARDHLPPADQWPEFRLGGFAYPEYLNAAVELTDRLVERGFGDNTALIGNGRRRTYKELTDWTNRLAIRQQTLNSQFTAMEVALGKLKDQGNWLSGQIANLPTTSKSD